MTSLIGIKRNCGQLYFTNMFLNMPSTKVNSGEILENCSTAKMSFCEMHKFRGQTEFQNFLSAKFLSFKARVPEQA